VNIYTVTENTLRRKCVIQNLQASVISGRLCEDWNCSFHICSQNLYRKKCAIWIYIFSHCFTADEAYFRVQNYPSSTCLYYKDYNGVDFVRKDECYNNREYYWIWTNYGQLLNSKSLECMTDDHITKSGTHYVILKKCNKSNQKQAWGCETIHNETYIQPKQSDRYMYYGHNWNYVTTKSIHWLYALKLRRFYTPEDVCAQGSLIVNLIT
jgi:hypothetical protein